jgi:peptidoglycan/LPS O-acetylase OafA/YrhL
MALLLQSVHADGNNKYGLFRIAGEFVAGASLCRLFHAHVGQNWNWNLIIPLVAAAAFLLLGYLLPCYSLVAYWCVPCLAIVVLGLAYGKSVWSRLLSTRLFLFGGYVSYSLYMVHTLCFIVLEKSFPRIEARPWSFAVDLTVAILAASATFYLVEEPARKKMRALLPATAGNSPAATGAWPERFGSKE